MSAPLFAKIETFAAEKTGWCSAEKAATIASIVLALRPKVAVEIGVWRGSSMIPCLLAIQHVGSGRGVAIDPWAASASVLDESPENAQWWGETVGQPGHDEAYGMFQAQLAKHDLARLCDVWRRRSDDCDPPACQYLHVDGNHAQQAVRDVDRYARKVDVGGIMILDDLNWNSGAVERAHELAIGLGFVDRYPLGTGVLMQRVRL